MKRLALCVMGLILVGPGFAYAWNPLIDLRDNLQWTFGKKAETGIAVKIGGAGDLEKGDTATSALAGIFDYHFLSAAYGGIKVNKNDAKVTDSFKIGLQLTSFFDLFKNPPTAEMAFMRNINVGPVMSMPVISRSHPVTWFLEGNYAFGGSKVVPTP